MNKEIKIRKLREEKAILGELFHFSTKVPYPALTEKQKSRLSFCQQWVVNRRDNIDIEIKILLEE